MNYHKSMTDILILCKGYREYTLNYSPLHATNGSLNVCGISSLQTCTCMPLFTQ